MMVKAVKNSKKDIELETEVIDNLAQVQESRQKLLQNKIEAAREEALERYNAHIKALEMEKAKAIQRYDDEIQRYKQLVKSLKQQRKEAKTIPVELEERNG